MSIEYRGETFEGYNKPKRTPNHPTKSHVVLAKEGSTIKLIRFGQQGVSGSPPREGEGKGPCFSRIWVKPDSTMLISSR